MLPFKQQTRRISQHFDTSTRTGKRNVIICVYALGFIGLHWVWKHSKGFRRTGEQSELEQNNNETTES